MCRLDEGEREAFAILYRRYFARVLQTARARMGPRLRARLESVDLVQSAFREALEHIDQLRHRSEGQFLRWISAIVTHKIHERLDHFRAQRRDIQREQRLPAPGDLELPARDPSPSQIAHSRERWDRLLACLDRLPEREREVILLKRFEKLSWKEVAEELGVPVRTAQDLELRAKRRLTWCLGSSDP